MTPLELLFEPLEIDLVGRDLDRRGLRRRGPRGEHHCEEKQRNDGREPSAVSLARVVRHRARAYHGARNQEAAGGGRAALDL